jgi:hypothetical protein
VNPVIPVFIASPSDVTEERDITEKAIHALAPRMARIFGVTLVPLRWEQFAPISSYDASHPQVGILRDIRPFSIFVGILWRRYGTKISDLNETGTESEFSHALQNRDRISILTYFREGHPERVEPPEEHSQRKKVTALKRRLRQRKVWSSNYRSVQEFQLRILPDLMEATLQLVLSKEPRKVLDYLKFFRFGSHHRLGMRPLLIVYPPITDPGPGHEAPLLEWRERLLPHVVYEDSKAIQDIEQAMRVLGREYKTITTDSPDLVTADPGDRIWVCVPRNRKAHRVLEDLGEERVRFQFYSQDGESPGECRLRWRTADGEYLQIRSPLAKYLAYSARPEERAPWRPAFGYTYCRDYAVLARFKMKVDPESSDSEYYYHYFVGGIRGLGTWGIGYLIDHQSSSLVRIAEEACKRHSTDDIQILLEVTYENFRITRIRDVSEQDAAFFEEHYSDEYIGERFATRPEWGPPRNTPSPSTSRKGWSTSRKGDTKTANPTDRADGNRKQRGSRRSSA